MQYLDDNCEKTLPLCEYHIRFSWCDSKKRKKKNNDNNNNDNNCRVDDDVFETGENGIVLVFRFSARRVSGELGSTEQ